VKKFDISSSTWTSVTTTGSVFTGRIYSTAILYNDYIYLLTGYDGSIATNDIIVFNIGTGSFSIAIPYSGYFSNRYYFAAALYMNDIYIIGGGYYSSASGGSAIFYNDMYKLSDIKPGTDTTYIIPIHSSSLTNTTTIAQLVLSTSSVSITSMITKTSMDALFASTGMFYRRCYNCDTSHQHIYYKRITPIPTGFSFYDLLIYWASTNNILNVDFRLYSTISDLQNDVNRWTYCDYDYPNIGFPRNCGPSGQVTSQWTSQYSSYSATAKTADYFIQPSACSDVMTCSSGYSLPLLLLIQLL
jgi:hypothetical protein